MEARNIPHLLVGGRSFHDREEVQTVRTALAAIEWPDDELSVFATLQGSLFAIRDDVLLEFRHRHGRSIRFTLRATPFRMDCDRSLTRSGFFGNCTATAIIDRYPRPLKFCWQNPCIMWHLRFALRGEQVLDNVLHLGARPKVRSLRRSLVQGLR